MLPGNYRVGSPSQNRHNLMLSMNTARWKRTSLWTASCRFLMTPDFRILPWVREFHYAISATVRAIPRARAGPANTASGEGCHGTARRIAHTMSSPPTLIWVGRVGVLDRVDMGRCCRWNAVPPPRDAPRRATNCLPMQEPSALSASPSPVAETSHGKRSRAGFAGGRAGTGSSRLHLMPAVAPMMRHCR